MKKDTFRKLVSEKILILDGATGTELARNGMPAGVSPEAWVLDNPSVLSDIQRTYVDSGSDIVYTCTFGGNRLKLAEFGLDKRTEEINTSLARISREAVGERAMVFGDIAPTGLFVEPFGELAFDEAVDVYAQQARALQNGGVDGFVIETMMDLQEARAALIGVKETSDLPVMVSMTFGADGRTLNGTDPLSALITFQSLGADAVGCNCSTGPQDMAKVIAKMKPLAKIPLLAKPNAGMPRLVNGVTKFDMKPEEFGSYAHLLVEAGASLIGGCCGTAPAYISELKKNSVSLVATKLGQKSIPAVCSYRETVCFSKDLPLTIFGGKINPSENKSLEADLLCSEMKSIWKLSQEQAREGASIIDINVHVEGADEATLMRSATLVAVKACGKPISIDTQNVDAAEKALRVYPGRAIINSISLDQENIESMLAVASRYGAMIVCMPLDRKGISKTSADAIENVEKVFAIAQKYNILPEDCLVDCLASTVSAGSSAHKRTLEIIDWCAQKRFVASLCGISNLSYGLETHQWIDSTFLCMAAGRGVTSVFIDTESEYTVNTAYSIDALGGRDAKFKRYIGRFGQNSLKVSERNVPRTPGEAVFDAVVYGDEDGIEQLIKKAIDNGENPRSLVDDRLISGINLVGEKFDSKEYFLPQLITCADTMRKGFTVLQPYLSAGGKVEQKGPKVILATVRGDIHDIGKNIVALMLNNYNFDVIDLGKDVSAESIILAAKNNNADIIGLSALMTTTMVEMKNVIDLARQENLTNVRFMVGGAVVDQHYADEIGAHGYACDAIGAVRLAQQFSSDLSK